MVGSISNNPTIARQLLIYVKLQESKRILWSLTSAHTQRAYRTCYYYHPSLSSISVSLFLWTHVINIEFRLKLKPKINFLSSPISLSIHPAEGWTGHDDD